MRLRMRQERGGIERGEGGVEATVRHGDVWGGARAFFIAVRYAFFGMGTAGGLSGATTVSPASRLLDRYVFDVVEQRSTMALFTARADGGSATPACSAGLL